MHISLQLQSERNKLVRNQNKALIIGVWVLKFYLIGFGILCAATIKSEPKIVVLTKH